MSDFRGQYMDMIHPSSDVKVTDKPNLINQPPIKAPSPIAPTKPVETAPSPETVKETDTYESPFLSNIEIEKRPLGDSATKNKFFNINSDAHDTFDVNEFINLDKPELPADDSGKGELEPELPSGEAVEEVPVEPEPELIESEPTESEIAEPEPTPEEEPEPTFEEESEVVAVAEPTEPTEIIKIPEPIESVGPTAPESPFAHASEIASPTPTRKSKSIWMWILIFILITIAGGAIGAIIYLLMG